MVTAAGALRPVANEVSVQGCRRPLLYPAMVRIACCAPQASSVISPTPTANSKLKCCQRADEPEKLTRRDAVILIKVMRRQAEVLTEALDVLWTPRDIDKVLWTYGR